MNRPRKNLKDALPDNLYRKKDKRIGKVYFEYRDPRTGRRHGVGSDREQAIKGAKGINAIIYAAMKEEKLRAIVSNELPSEKLSSVIKKHLELCVVRKLKPVSIAAKKLNTGIWLRELGAGTYISRITVRDIVDVLDKYADRPSMAQRLRSVAIDVWKDAMQEGWTTDNIPLRTRSTSVEVIRSRLTLENFNAIHAEALKLPDRWVARSMELALVTAQRREDIGAFEFRKRKESTSWVEGNNLFVMQIKTKTKLVLPLDIGLNGLTIGGVIKLCRDNIATNALLHYNCTAGKVHVGESMGLDTISRKFAECRDAAGIVCEKGKSPVTFHEIRSLAIRLYTKQHGAVFAQSIAGHKNAEMTAVYRDTRGAEWLEVKAG